MNQLINISKIDYFLASTIDDSNMEESTFEDKSSKSGMRKAKSKIRTGSGAQHLKSKKAKMSKKKNADLIENESQASTTQHQRKTVNSKLKKRTGSTSPFQHQNLRNRKKNHGLKDEQKSTDVDEDSKLWGLAGKAIDKRNSTKITHHTNSENDENPWVSVKGNISKNNKIKKNTKIGHKENSVVRKKNQKNPEKMIKKNKKQSQAGLNNELEEEKEYEESEIIDSYSYKFEINNKSPQKDHSNNHNHDQYEDSKVLNKTETVMGQNRKSKIYKIIFRIRSFQ